MVLSAQVGPKFQFRFNGMDTGKRPKILKGKLIFIDVIIKFEHHLGGVFAGADVVNTNQQIPPMKTLCRR